MAQHGRRITDFTRGQQLGKNDHVVQWPRPPKPKTMSAKEYARYPASITRREVEVDGQILVTTLFDPKIVSARVLAALYKMRWNIEVDFRNIKATLLPKRGQEMDVLCCKSQPSFTGAKRLQSAFADQLRRASGDQIRTLIETVLACIATLRLPHRPDRIEPRAKKRRPKNLRLLTVLRHVVRDLIYAQRVLDRVTLEPDPLVL
ncbi:MAG: hypothetical protein ABIP64_03620 [Burkholderiales bacterium]